jgi:hypothetical protein
MLRFIANNDRATPNEINGSGTEGIARQRYRSEQRALCRNCRVIWIVRIDAALLSPESH